MANKYLKIYPTPLAIKEMPMETMRYYYTLLRQVKIQTPAGVGKDVEQLELSDTIGENVKWLFFI